MLFTFLATDIANFRTNKRDSFSPIRFASQLSFGVGANIPTHQIDFNAMIDLYSGFVEAFFCTVFAGFEAILAGFDAVTDVLLKHEWIYLDYQESM